MSTGGDAHLLAVGDLTAVVTEVGGGLRSLEHRGRPLVRPYAADEVRPRYRGALLAPWANRVGDGRYFFDGREHQLPLTEPERGNALHGLVCWARFDVDRVDEATVVARHDLVPQPGYPFRLAVTATYALGEDGLTTTVTGRNVGDVALPWGAGGHPYLVAGDGPVDGWDLRAPATRVLPVDPERLLPADPPATTPVTGTDLDFTTTRRVGNTRLDHAFTGLAGGADGLARVVLTDPGTGRGAQLTWDPALLPWLQLHTADLAPPETSRAGLAVEPMTAPPDSFRSGVDLVVLEPDDAHTVSWTIEPVGG